MIPVFGAFTPDSASWIQALIHEGLQVVLVNNNPATGPDPVWPEGCWVQHNHNCGGIAGGFNRGVRLACDLGASWITLLDQDSRLQPQHIQRLLDPWRDDPGAPLLVGPLIWDQQRALWQGPDPGCEEPMRFWPTRLLISSGTTFAAADWSRLGAMHEGLFIDFVDHAWAFRAQERGFRLFQHPRVRLRQRFGEVHPNPFCRVLGMQLYSPMRHYYSLRNLRWLVLQRWVPLDLRVKELLKMSVKPWLWLFCEPQRCANLKAIYRALMAELPAPYDP